MASEDPIKRAADDTRDLQEVATWEPRSRLDLVATSVHRVGLSILRAIIIVLAVAVLLAQLVLGGLAVIADPIIGTLVVLSVVPALAIAGYIWYIDVTTREPLSLLVATFLLGVLFAGFAGIVNAIGGAVFLSAGAVLAALMPGLEAVWMFLGLMAFFFLVVGPVEEAVKLLAVRLYAYRSERFDAVINGAVYGAVAGLGFATIENALYIAQGLGTDVGGFEALRPGGDIAAARALAGPGHVLYSAIAGFYLGLAKFNPDRAGPLVVKGILIAAVFHALYNTLVGPAPEFIAATVGPITEPVGLFGFVVVYLALVGVFLYRKIARYARVYHDVGLDRGAD